MQRPKIDFGDSYALNVAVLTARLLTASSSLSVGLCFGSSQYRTGFRLISFRSGRINRTTAWLYTLVEEGNRCDLAILIVHAL